MNEVLLTFDIPGKHTIEKKGTSMVAIHTTGCVKSVLGCHGDGQKWLPMVIFKPKEKIPARVKMNL